MSVRYVLYTGPSCSLCKKAEDLIYAAGVGASDLEKVDITTSLELKKLYGLKIPVLHRKDLEQELFWPFDQQQLAEYL
ncbi:MAG: glutaredoxin family protein [Porticoccaceae bacterium]|jgi:hypothetical protein|nr:glutaredoxin family protein [Porticoccaceae bacterium]